MPFHTRTKPLSSPAPDIMLNILLAKICTECIFLVDFMAQQAEIIICLPSVARVITLTILCTVWVIAWEDLSPYPPSPQHQSRKLKHLRMHLNATAQAYAPNQGASWGNCLAPQQRWATLMMERATIFSYSLQGATMHRLYSQK